VWTNTVDVIAQATDVRQEQPTPTKKASANGADIGRDKEREKVKRLHSSSVDID
jgi:hypothetical protein